MIPKFIIGAFLFGSICLVQGRPQYGIDCTREQDGPGKWKFICGGGADKGKSGAAGGPPTITLEHILWIQQEPGHDESIDVEIPNYKLNEIIKAGFKGGSAGETNVNILVKKPEISYEAEVDKAPSFEQTPNVHVKYEPVESLVVHYPNDKEYKISSERIVPPSPRPTYLPPGMESPVSENKETSTAEEAEPAIPDIVDAAIPDDKETSIPDIAEPAISDDKETSIADIEEPAISDDKETSIPDIAEPATSDDKETSIADIEEPAISDDKETSITDIEEPAIPDDKESSLSDVKKRSISGSLESSLSEFASAVRSGFQKLFGWMMPRNTSDTA